MTGRGPPANREGGLSERLTGDWGPATDLRPVSDTSVIMIADGPEVTPRLT